jgi:hypothetical protein
MWIECRCMSDNRFSHFNYVINFSKSQRDNAPTADGVIENSPQKVDLWDRSEVQELEKWAIRHLLERIWSLYRCMDKLCHRRPKDVNKMWGDSIVNGMYEWRYSFKKPIFVNNRINTLKTIFRSFGTSEFFSLRWQDIHASDAKLWTVSRFRVVWSSSLPNSYRHLICPLEHPVLFFTQQLQRYSWWMNVCNLMFFRLFRVTLMNPYAKGISLLFLLWILIHLSHVGENIYCSPSEKVLNISEEWFFNFTESSYLLKKGQKADNQLEKVRRVGSRFLQIE